MAIAEGIYVGGAVEVSGVPGGQDVNGLCGQVLEYLIDSGKCSVMLTNGSTTEVETKYLKPPAAGSFDAMLGPCQQLDVMGDELSRCIFAKGYCVLQVCQDAAQAATAIAAMDTMSQEGKLARLPEAVEQGYFGDNRVKTCWLTGDDALKDPLVQSSDSLLSSVVDCIMPSSLDTLGGMIESRTPALVSVGLLDVETAEYPYPTFDDKEVHDYYQAYTSGLLRAVLNVGPEPVKAKLKAKGADYSDAEFSAAPGAMILFKPKCFDYSYEASGSTAMAVTATFTSKPETPSLVVLDGAGMSSISGPGAPTKPLVTVETSSTRMCGNFDDTAMYSAGLAYGCDCAVEFPLARFDWTMYHEPDPKAAFPWQFDCKHMGYVEGLEYFDNRYFNIPAQEAATMDTMHRHTLEVGAASLSKIGITKKVADKAPKHAGCAVALDKDDWDKAPKDEWLNGAGVNVQAILANRFNYTFNLKGVSLICDTACSSSLTAAHQAKLFLVDRVNDKLDFFVVIGLHQCLALNVWMGNNVGHMFTSIGRCQTFNNTADGFLRGDNCSGIIMNFDSPTKEATWRGSMIGQNGRAATMTAPNGIAQEDVIWKALRDASIEPPEGQIWSCHGTGTSLGDPIEVGAMRKVQTKNGRNNDALMVNTNKPFTGHSEGGAAMTSIIAMLIQVQLQRVNTLCHLDVFNAHMDVSNLDAVFPTELNTTNVGQSNGHVSSFGFGGTNAHCVMFAAGQNSGSSQDILKKLAEVPYPELRITEGGPDSWEYYGFAADAKSGDKYAVTLSDSSRKYVLLEEAQEIDGCDVAYTITGSFGEPVQMEDGMVPGLKNVVVEVPENGEVEFNFYQTCKTEVVLAPKAYKCWKKSAPCEGPAEGLTNTWLAKGVPGSELRIDLFASQGMYAVTWVSL